MEPGHMWTFFWEIRKQSEIAAKAFESVAAKPEPVDLWPSIQLFLGAAANISKLLWGSGRNAKAAAASRVSLRSALGVSDDSDLRGRTLRDHFEHVDERVDDWWDRGAEVGGRSMINYNDAPIEAIRNVVPDLAEDELFRHFDRDTNTLRFWADVLELEPLVEEIARVGQEGHPSLRIHETDTMM
jgi:hypothetical protein